MKLATRCFQTGRRDLAYAEQLGTYVEKIVDSLAAPEGGAAAFVEGFIITDDDHYGKTIAEASPGEGFTSDGYFLGVGKTVTLAQEARPVSRIIVRIWLVEHLLDGGYLPGTVPPDDMWLCVFAIAHELGHAVDNERRKLVADVEGPSERNWIRRSKTKGLKNLLSEIAAQSFASRIVTRTAFEQQRLSLDEDLEKIISNLDSAKAQYRVRAIDVDAMATIGSLAGWRILDLLAKCRVLQLALPEGERGPPLGCKGLEPFTSELFRGFEALLDDILRCYPAEPTEIMESISGVWADIVALLGVDFEERDEGFGLRVL